MSSHKFFRCKKCGNLVGLINNAGAPMTCCGEVMQELIPNTAEAAVEKHLPEVTIEGSTVTVKVGSVAHPMLQEHHIEFIYLKTKNGGQRKALRIGAEPVAVFKLIDDKAEEVYAFCNLHGLWKIEL